jgi:hypothetical protein
MMEPDLDNRNRVRNEKISRNYGSTLVRDLRERYGENFAAGHADTLTLRKVITVHSLASTFPEVCADRSAYCADAGSRRAASSPESCSDGIRLRASRMVLTRCYRLSATRCFWRAVVFG